MESDLGLRNVWYTLHSIPAMSSIFYITAILIYRCWPTTQEGAQPKVHIATREHHTDTGRCAEPARPQRRNGHCRSWLDQQLEVVEYHAHGGNDLHLAHSHHIVDQAAQQLEIAHADRSAQTVGDGVRCVYRATFAAAKRLVCVVRLFRLGSDDADFCRHGLGRECRAADEATAAHGRADHIQIG